MCSNVLTTHQFLMAYYKIIFAWSLCCAMATACRNGDMHINNAFKRQNNCCTSCCCCCCTFRPTLRCLLCLVVFPQLWVTSPHLPQILEDCRKELQQQTRDPSHPCRWFEPLVMFLWSLSVILWLVGFQSHMTPAHTCHRSWRTAGNEGYNNKQGNYHINAGDVNYITCT